MKFSADDPSDSFGVAIKSLSVPVAKAAKQAIVSAAALLKQSAREHITSSGFSPRFANAYKTYVYPSGNTPSITAAASGLLTHMFYSDILSMGGTIRAHNGKLWLPFKTTPKLDSRKSTADITDYKKKNVEMISFKSKAGTPLLAVSVEMSRSQANRANIKLTAGEVLSGKKKRQSRSKQSRNISLVNKAVPLFHAVSAVNIKKRFDWDKVQTKVQSQVPDLYYNAIQKLAGE